MPLPKPSVDTGAGLERIAAVMCGVTNNYHTPLFLPLIERVEQVVGIKYPYRPGQGVGTANGADGRAIDPASFRVIADHARAVAFLLADGIFPSNEGRGYVLRRILRRAVRHAWLLGRREPTLVHVVEKVIEMMHDVYPELKVRRKHIIETTKAEEERFLATIGGGLERFETLAPIGSTQGSNVLRGTISGDDAFKLYDTFGFPIDLTELMARERGYLVDIAGFEQALQAQRHQSQEERRSKKIAVVADDLGDASQWEHAPAEASRWQGAPGDAAHGRFVGYDVTTIETDVAAVRHLPDGRVAMMLRESPFYAESGGQVSDRGTIEGAGWRVTVDDVKKIDGRIAAIGTVEGEFKFGMATARVPGSRRRDTERNHTATHLLHAALREVLGDHVHQAGSVVEPDRLRFDFTHHGPVKPGQLEQIEHWVNHAIWENVDVTTKEKKYADAVAGGAMALFGEKYGDVVRVVEVPGYSVELCGGTHVRNTGQIAACRIVHEQGVAAGVRRIVAITGPKAFASLRDKERALDAIAERLKVNVAAGGVEAIARRLEGLLGEKKTLEKKLEEALRGSGGGSAVQGIVAGAEVVQGGRVAIATVDATDVDSLKGVGDAVREAMPDGVAVLGAVTDGKGTLLVVVGDGLRGKGLSAGVLVKDIAALAGGRGGGKPHMAQAGLADEASLKKALAGAADVVKKALQG